MASEAQQMEGMPIRQVTLYDNGFAVFQREKVIQGHGNIDLYFSSDHMKSVLESLQFNGDASTKVGNIAYEVTKPEASISLSSREPIVGLIRSLVGRMMSITFQDADNLEVIEGRVLGVDNSVHDPTSGNELEHVSILQEGGFMRMFPIKNIKNFHILEAQVQEDLAFSLDLRRMTGNDDHQKLSVFYSDIDTPQNLIARYGFQVSLIMIIIFYAVKLENLAGVEFTSGHNVITVIATPETPNKKTKTVQWLICPPNFPVVRYIRSV